MLVLAGFHFVPPHPPKKTPWEGVGKATILTSHSAWWMLACRGSACDVGPWSVVLSQSLWIISWLRIATKSMSLWI